MNGTEPSRPHRHVRGGGEYGREPFTAYADPDGYELVDAWECADECPIRLLDAQSGERGISKGSSRGGQRQQAYGMRGQDIPLGFGDRGGASRYFATFRYVPKASAAERNRGLPPGERCEHPTVKPLALMKYLLTLVTPPGGTILDPFAGSGSTLIAAAALGFPAIGIEQDESYCRLAVQRLGDVREQGA